MPVYLHKTRLEMELIEALKSRYATKKFNPSKIIPEPLVDHLIEATRLTPTSYGLQLMKLVVVEDQQLRESLVAASFGQHQVKDSSHLFVLCREKEVSDRHIEHYIQTIAQTRNLELNKLDRFKNALEKSILVRDEIENNHWMERQVYIALGNLLTSCAILGVDACPMEGFVPAEYDKILGLNQRGLKSVLVVPVGYRADDDLNATNKKVRRSTTDFLVKI
jgi:nitroreductase